MFWGESTKLTGGIALLFVAATASFAGTQAPTDKLDQIVAKYDTKTAPGVEILVVQDGKELCRRTAGLANVEYGVPITKDSIFHIASVSKQFTAFAACLLEQEGKLNMDDDVRKYLPELPNYGTKITLRNLATHTSGLRDFYALGAIVGFTEADVSYNSQILKLLFQQKNLNFKPGTKFEYGNSSFTLLGEVVSRVSKKPLPEFLNDRVFAPLGMTRTQLVNDPELIIPNRAYSYYSQGGVLYKRILGPVNVGSTGINSTADDLVRWSQNFENPKVGNPKVFQRMSERATLSDGTSLGYALGQEFKNYRGVKIAFHGGGDAGYRSYLIRVPDKKLTVVVLGNSREFFPVDLAYGALDAFLFNGPAPEKAKPNFDPKLLTKFVGDYEIFPGNIVHLTTEKGKLYLQPYGDPNKMELPQVGDYEFDYPVFTRSRFTFGKSGNFKWQLFDIPYGGTRVNLKPFKPAQANLNELVGTYYSPELRDEYTLSIVKGQLIAAHRRNEDIALIPIQRDWYHGSSYFFGKVVAERDRRGRVTGLQVSTQGASDILFKRVPTRRP